VLLGQFAPEVSSALGQNVVERAAFGEPDELVDDEVGAADARALRAA
jgi:hypothetical protein